MHNVWLIDDKTSNMDFEMQNASVEKEFSRVWLLIHRGTGKIQLWFSIMVKSLGI